MYFLNILMKNQRKYVYAKEVLLFILSRERVSVNIIFKKENRLYLIFFVGNGTMSYR